jgi:hypothetical protein
MTCNESNDDYDNLLAPKIRGLGMDLGIGPPPNLNTIN